VNDAALEELLDDNGPDLYAYLARRCGGPADAEDALSEVFLTAWRRRDQLPPSTHEARLWLFGVAANTIRNQQRAYRRRHALVRRLMTDPTWHQTHTNTDGSDDVRDAIDALPMELAELVRLRHWEGFTLAEAATIMSIPAPTARTRYHAARRRLRVMLGPSLEEDPGERRPGTELSLQSPSRTVFPA
jgi:RNA polymerase sigma factor (sigma-70 family)